MALLASVLVLLSASCTTSQTACDVSTFQTHCEGSELVSCSRQTCSSEYSTPDCVQASVVSRYACPGAQVCGRRGKAAQCVLPGLATCPGTVLDVGATYDALVADLDGNGSLDALALGYHGELTVLEHDQGWKVGASLATGTLAAAVDVDGDRVLDLVLSDRTALTVRRGQGGGTFAASSTSTPLPEGTRAVRRVGAADLDRDSYGDVVLFLENDAGVASLAVLHGTSEGDFGRVQLTTLTSDRGYLIDAARPAALADIDGDGWQDVVLPTGRTVEVRYGEATGGFGGAVVLSVDYASFVVGDLDKDGRADLVFAGASKEGKIATVLGRADRSLAPRLGDAMVFGTRERIALVDIDGDGALDLVGTDGQDLGAFRGDGAGRFASAKVFDIAPSVGLPASVMILAALRGPAGASVLLSAPSATGSVLAFSPCGAVW